MYDDARNAPKTAEDHEKNAYGSTCLTAAEARRILSAHKVPGRSKLDADAARDMASEQWPDEVRVVREAKVVRYRWSVAHGLGVSYTELAEIERRAGVEPHAVRIRISFDDIDDARAANEVYERIQETHECTLASVYDRRRGGRALYFEAIVPKVPVPVK